jgi:pimeloyl-ACP methyl ester carboxylesterase
MSLHDFDWGKGWPNPYAVAEGGILLQYLYWDDQQAFESYLATQGSYNVLFWFGNRRTLPIQVAIFGDGTDYWMACAGTTDWTQWVANFFGTQPVAYDRQAQVKVHSYFNAERKRIWKDVIPGRIPTTGGTHKVRIWGHSLGGAIGYLLANDFAASFADPRRVQLITMAAPKALTTGYAGPQPAFIARVVHSGDLVPFLPPRSAIGAILAINERNTEGFKKLIDYEQYGISYFYRDSGVWEASNPPEENYPLEFRWQFNASLNQRHVLATYNQKIADVLLPRLGEVVTPGEAATRTELNRLGGAPDRTVYVPLPPASSYTTPGEQNQSITGNPAGPITAGNIDTVKGAQFLVSGTRTPARNIALFGGTISMGSTFYKMTCAVNNGIIGRSFTTVWSGGDSDWAAAFLKANELAQTFSRIFGNDTAATGQAYRITKGAPQVKFVRVTDALKRGLGQPLTFRDGDQTFAGYKGGTAWAADAMMLALSMRLTATINGLGSRTVHPNFIVTGQPDNCVQSGVYVGDTLTQPSTAPGTGTWDDLCRAFLTYLHANSFGVMGQIDPDNQKDVTSFLFANGVLSAVVPAHGYGNNDRVSIFECSDSSISGRYRIRLVDSNTFILLGAPEPFEEITEITAKVRKTYDAATKTKLLSFYKYTRPPGDYQTPLPLTPRKKSPGRQFVPVSFSKRKRRRKA